MRLPDLEALAIFACVVEHKSFTSAAHATGMSKATVSKAVSRLEASLGVGLFHRTSRRLALTDSGRALADHAAQMLGAARAAEESARDGAAALAGRIRMSAPMSYGLAHIAPLLAAFLSKHEHIDIELSLSDATTDIVAEGFDLAIRIGAMPDSSLRARLLGPAPMRIVAAPAYLERHGRPSHAGQLAEHRVLGYTNLTGPISLRGPDGAEVHLRPNGPFNANSGEALMPALIAGLGIAILPDFIVGSAIADRRLETILADWHSPPLNIHLLTPPGALRPARVAALIDFLTIAVRGSAKDSISTDSVRLAESGRLITN